MSRASKTLERVLRGNADRSIRFDELCSLLKSLGLPNESAGVITFTRGKASKTS
jgi:hypothetical protein